MFEGIMSKIRPRTAQELRDGETSGEKLKTRTPERAGKEDASPKTGKCKKCGAVLSAEVVKKNLFICPECGGYFRLRAYRRILMLADTGSFTEWDKTMPVQNPLDFPDYEEKILEAQEETGLNEAVVTGRMKIEGIPCAIGVCDARYLMSSMGRNMGEKIARLAERAEEEKLPLIIFSCSGGARMQEGIISLMQMVKTSEAIGRLQASGQLFISFLTDPTMGGVTASFAMLGDMILAEPGALIGFTGQRVIQQTIGGTLPEASNQHKNIQRCHDPYQEARIDCRLIHLTESRCQIPDPAHKNEKTETDPHIIMDFSLIIHSLLLQTGRFRMCRFFKFAGCPVIPDSRQSEASGFRKNPPVRCLFLPDHGIALSSTVFP